MNYVRQFSKRLHWRTFHKRDLGRSTSRKSVANNFADHNIVTKYDEIRKLHDIQIEQLIVYISPFA